MTQTTDSVGTDIVSKVHDSFGRLVLLSGSSSGDRIGFTGREWENPIGLYYYRARFYDPNIGRFITTDPLGLAAGDLNFYRYVFNSSTTWRDPNGEILPILAALWAAYEIGSSLYDAYELGKTLLDPCASSTEKWLMAGAFGAGLFAPGGGYGTGLKKASKGLKKIFNLGKKSKSIRGASIIDIRATLKADGFTQTLAKNKKGYLFTNDLGEQVRIMRGSDEWYVRTYNQADNYLDEFGNVADLAITHGIEVLSR